jgi:polyisoprenoid-binding protein YceI
MSTAFDAPTTAIDDITGDYTLDVSHSRLGFVARHAMVTKVRGQFGAFTGNRR